MVFGYSLELASRVAIRLALLLALAAALLWLTLLRGSRPLSLDCTASGGLAARRPELECSAPDARTTGSRYRRSDAIGSPAVSRSSVQPLLLTTATFLMLVGFAVGGTLPGGIDAAVFQFFEALQTPWGDAAMLRISSLGDYPALTAVGAVVLLWLAWRRAWAASAFTGSQQSHSACSQRGSSGPFSTCRCRRAWRRRRAKDSRVLTASCRRSHWGSPLFSWHGRRRATWRWAPYAIAALGRYQRSGSPPLPRRPLAFGWYCGRESGNRLDSTYRHRVPTPRLGTVGSLGLASVASLTLIGATLWSLYAAGQRGRRPRHQPRTRSELAEERLVGDRLAAASRPPDRSGRPKSGTNGHTVGGRSPLTRSRALTEGGFVTPRTFGFDSLLLPLNHRRPYSTSGRFYREPTKVGTKILPWCATIPAKTNVGLHVFGNPGFGRITACRSGFPRLVANVSGTPRCY